MFLFAVAVFNLCRKVQCKHACFNIVGFYCGTTEVVPGLTETRQRMQVSVNLPYYQLVARYVRQLTMLDMFNFVSAFI
jgi:hypothetical protein